MNDKALEKLIKQAQKGDVEAFERIIEEHQAVVYSIAFKMAGNESDAFDMAQESFLKIYRNLNKFDGRSKLSTWIYRVVSNTCLDELKKRKRHIENTKSFDEEIDTSEDKIVLEIRDDKPLPDEQLENAELRDVLNKAVSELSEQHKAVLVLRDIEGFSYEDISEILNINAGTVKSRLSRARMALRKILQNNYAELFEKYFVK